MNLKLHITVFLKNDLKPQCLTPITSIYMHSTVPNYFVIQVRWSYCDTDHLKEKSETKGEIKLLMKYYKHWIQKLKNY